MKTQTLTFILMFVSVVVHAQMPIDTATHKYQYREVLKAEASKDDLYSRARQWFVVNYKDASEVLQIQDKESGLLVGKGFLTVNFQGGQRKVYHTITIECKEGRYRLTITDFTLKFSSAYSEKPFELLSKNDFWGLDKLYSATNSKIDETIKSIVTVMQSKTDDW